VKGGTGRTRMEVEEDSEVQKSNSLIGLRGRIHLSRRPPCLESNLGSSES
jgi:hypothetical protein